jgi:hypothetical protein
MASVSVRLEKRPMMEMGGKNSCCEVEQRMERNERTSQLWEKEGYMTVQARSAEREQSKNEEN